jgi:Fe-S-cluster containining protein
MKANKIGISTALLEIIHSRLADRDLPEILGNIYDQVQFLEKLRASGTPDMVIMLSVHSILDMQMQRGEGGQKISCRKGCAFCCKMNVDVNAMEVQLILHYVKHHRIPIDREYLKAQTKVPKEQLAFTPGISACVFLQRDRTCAIYPVRPMACRKYAVTTPAELCNIEKYPAARLGVLADIDAEILVSALDNIQQAPVDGLHSLLLERLNVPS